MDFGKSESAQTCNQLACVDVVEECRVRTAKDGDRFILAFQEFSALPDMVGDDFGFLRADFNAVTAAYAAITDDFGVVLVNADRFDRAVAYAGVAFATVFLDGYDRIHNAPCLSNRYGILQLLARLCQP